MSTHYRDKYQGEFGPVSEADITRANHGPDDVVQHGHEDIAGGRYRLHEHAGGAEAHTH